MHQGRVFTEGAVYTEGYRITGARKLIKGILHNCIKCNKLRGKVTEQRMADLPPITYVGLDVFGPWPVIMRRTRGQIGLSLLICCQLSCEKVIRVKWSTQGALNDYGWPLPSYLCPIWIYLDVLFSTASIMHLCAISLDRYIAIRNPFHHSRFNSHTKARIKIMAVWTISVGISMPIPVLGLRDHSKVFKDGSCLLTDNNFVLVGSFVAFFVPLTIMVITYFLTINALQNEATLCLDQLVPRPKWSTTFTLSFLPQTSLSSEKLLRRSISREAGGRGSSGGLAGDRGSVSGSLFGRRTMQSISNEQKASKVLGVVFFLFVVMWCPFFITNVLVVVCDPAVCDAGLMGGLLNVFVWVGYLSSAVNPLVYTLFNKTYRAAFLRYVRCQYQPEKKPLQLILVNTIPPLAYSSTQLPLGDIRKLRNGAAHSSGEVKEFSLPGRETEKCRPDKSHGDKDESCV
eukprot:superscaffoldBa00000902_g7917